MKPLAWMTAGFALFVAGCVNPQATVPTSNPSVDLKLLFEHDGIKVYRFYDMEYRYYVDARGSTISTKKTTSGEQGEHTNTVHTTITTVK